MPYWGAYPYWGYPYPWGLGPLWGDPFYYDFHPGFYTGFHYAPNLGGIKVSRAGPDASVYIDGAYAGEARKLKTMWLEPGAYNLEVREPSRPAFSKRVYVLSGKTLDIDAEAEIARNPKEVEP